MTGLQSADPLLCYSLLYSNSIHPLPKLAGYDICLAVTCRLTCFTCAFECKQKNHRGTHYNVFGGTMVLTLWGT